MVNELSNILKETRSQILSTLKRAGRLTVEQIAEAINVSKVSIRRHLDLLKRDGLVSFELEKHERGRPVHVYSLTHKSRLLFTTGSSLFTLDLLRQVETVFGETGLQRILQSQAEEVALSLSPEFDDLDFDSKVKRLFDRMDERGFDISLSRLDDGSFLVRHQNCPIVAVAASYEQVCQQELNMYERLLGTKVVRDCRIASGAHCCDYKILPPRVTDLSLVHLSGVKGRRRDTDFRDWM